MWLILSLSFAVFTTISIFVLKHVSKYFSPLESMVVSQCFTVLLMFFYLVFFGGFPKHLDGLFFQPVILAGIFDILGGLAAYKAIKISSVSLIAPISSFNPIFVTIIAALLLREVPTPIKFAGIIIIVIGAYLLNISDVKQSYFAPIQKLFSHKGVQLFLAANFFWGVTPIFQKQAIFLTTPDSPLFVAFAEMVLTTFVLLPFVFKQRKTVVGKVKRFGLWFFINGLLATLASYAAFTAFSLVHVGYATAVFKLSALFTILGGGLFFKEKRIVERILGAGVMVLGTILLAI